MNRATAHGPGPQAGFSLVELLVALVFTLVLMLGMAQVFQSSFSSAVRSSDRFANSRRSSMSLDMLYDDLNSTGMFLTDLTLYPDDPGLTLAAPGFYVTPNVSYAQAGLDPQGSLPASWAYPAATADQLYLYLDAPLPTDGILQTFIPGLIRMESAGTTVPDAQSYDLLFPDPRSASAVKQGMTVLFRDHWDTKLVSDVPVVNGNTVTVTTRGTLSLGGYDNAAGGPTGRTPAKAPDHLAGRSVVVLSAAQQVRYSISCRALDPSDPTRLIPCLVREQGPFGGAFDPSLTTIVTENVIGFKVFLSANQGASWAGLGYAALTATGGDVGPWNDTSPAGPFRGALNAVLATTGRTGHQDTLDPYWFREIPVIVRIDLLTRTMQKRGEYGNPGAAVPTADYGTRVQTLMLVPRHFGLPF